MKELVMVMFLAVIFVGMCILWYELVQVEKQDEKERKEKEEKNARS